MSEHATKDRLFTKNMERELVLLCDGLDGANRELHAFFAPFSHEQASGQAAGARLRDNQERWETMAFRAAAMQARTLEGVRARVRALGREFVADILRSAELPDEAERVMIEALIRDLTADD